MTLVLVAKDSQWTTGRGYPRPGMLGSKLLGAAVALAVKVTAKTGLAMPGGVFHQEQRRRCSRAGQTWVLGAAVTGKAAPARVGSLSEQVQPRREPRTAQAV